MGEKHKILSVGGDMRSVYCAARLATEYDTSILGFDAEDIPLRTAHLRCVKEV